MAAVDSVRLDDLVDIPEDEVEEEFRIIQEIVVAGKKVGAPVTLLARRNPYGHVVFALKGGGPVPGILQGSFTSLHAAEAAVLQWQANSPKESVSIAPVEISENSSMISLDDLESEDKE